MALPALEKTYQFNVNNVIAAGADELENVRKVLLQIKNALIGFATLPWTVVGSSNAATAAMDAVDRWSVYTNLSWNTSAAARSWIVLKQTGLAANFQMLIALTSNAASNEHFCDIVISPASGFSGASTTARPTAADEVVIHSGAATQGWIGNFAGTAFTTNTHVMKSTDSKVTRWFICSAGKVVSYFAIEQAADPVTGWTVPVVVTSVVSVSTTVDHPTYANLNDLNTAAAGFLATTKFGLYLTAEGFIAGMNGEQLAIVANEISSEWMMGPVGVVSTDVGKRGRHGRLYDIWWGTTVHENGTTFPADTSRQFALFGDIIVPWNGSIPVVT